MAEYLNLVVGMGRYPYGTERWDNPNTIVGFNCHHTGWCIQKLWSGMLTMCWSDGVSCLPLDFSLLSSSDAKKRLCDSQKVIDKRCCAYQRRKEAIVKATGHLEAMVKRILSTGIHAQYLLMDSWFTMPTTVTALAEHIDVIGMVKRTPKVFYRHNGHQMNLMSIYAKLKKRRGRAKILASTLVQL